MSDMRHCLIMANKVGQEFGIESVERLKGYCQERERDKLNLSKTMSEEFANREVRVKPLESVRKKDVHFIGLIREDGTYNMYKDFFEILAFLDALNRAGAKSINLYLPGIPFLRQDAKFEGREPITAKMVFNLIVAAAGKPLERIITMDMHTKSEQGFVDLPLDDLKAMPLFLLYSKRFFDKDIVVISADAGAAEKNKKFADFLGVEYFAMPKTRKQGEVAELALPKESLQFLKNILKNKNIVMVEDMIDTGGTLITMCNVLKYLEVASITVFATHGIFSRGAEDKLRNSGIKIIITDTIPRPQEYYEKNKDWLTVISVTEYFAEAIYANQVADSMSFKINQKFADAQEEKGNLILFNQ